jgi:hypothetical protein
MITDKIKELEALKQKAAALEEAVAEERQRVLAALPKEYGFDNIDDFVDAVLEASGGRRGATRRRGRPPGRAATGRRGKTGRAPRATITDETRAQVKKMVEAGKTGSEIAKAVGISLPSVQNIKKALGLVQARK